MGGKFFLVGSVSTTPTGPQKSTGDRKTLVATWEEHQGTGLNYAGEGLRVRARRQVRAEEHTRKHECHRGKPEGELWRASLTSWCLSTDYCPCVGMLRQQGSRKFFKFTAKSSHAHKCSWWLPWEAEAGSWGECTTTTLQVRLQGSLALWDRTLSQPRRQEIQAHCESSWISPGPFCVVAKTEFFHVVCFVNVFAQLLCSKQNPSTCQMRPTGRQCWFPLAQMWTVDERSRFFYRKNGAWDDGYVPGLRGVPGMTKWGSLALSRKEFKSES